MVGANILDFVGVPMPDHRHMLAEELMYRHGAPLAHVVAYHEQLRMKRKASYMQHMERRTGSQVRKL